MATVTSTKRHLDVTSDTYQSNGNVVIGGDLTVNGSTTTLDTQNLIVEDKNIIIGQVSTPSDTTADGGGITLKGATDKTIYWSNSDDEWKFNQGIEITSGIITVPGGTSTQWNTAYGWGDHSGLYAAASHTHAASDITSGTFADARIALSNITQHTDPKYLRSNANDSFSGLLTSTLTTSNALEVGGIRGLALGSQTGDYIHLYERVHIGYPGGWGASQATAPSNGLGVWGSIDLGMSGSGVLQMDGTTVLTATRVLQNVTNTNWDAAYTYSQVGHLPLAGGTMTGNIAMSNYNITGVNQLEINDPGEGIIWKGGSSGDITLAVVDDTSDNILRLSGTNAELQVGTNRVLTTADEGSGNGLDADTLDGQHGSYYLAWSNLTGVPSTFTPSAHTLDSHSNVTITSNSIGEILKWNGSAWVNNTLAEAGIAAASHTHDDRYYTETETNNFFSGTTAITGYNKTNWDAAYTYSQVGHLPLSGGTIDGTLVIDTDTGAAPLTITRLGSASQSLKIWVDDSFAFFQHEQDEDTGVYGSFRFIGDAGGANPVFQWYHGATQRASLDLGNGNSTLTGTLTASGYNDSNWNTAYNNSIVSAAVTGTTTKTLTLTQQDAGTIQATWTDETGSWVDGTGTASYIPKWLDSDTLTNSIIYDNGTNVGIGTASPGNKLTIQASTTSYDGVKIQGTNAPGITLLHQVGTATNNYIYATGNSTTTQGVIVISADDGNTGGDSSIRFRVDGTEELRIEPGVIDVWDNRITNLAAPSVGDDAANKTYVDNAISGISAVGGSGTANYIPKWSSSSALTDSTIYESTAGVGIGTASPGAVLEVFGGDAIINYMTVGKGYGTGVTNTSFGYQVYGTASGTNIDNTVFGYRTLYAANGALRNTAIGKEALRSLTSGDDNTAVGSQANYSLTVGGSNVAIGQTAGFSSTGGSYNVAIGRSAGYGNLSSSCIAIGYNSLQAANSASGTIAIGVQALQDQTSGAWNIGIGYSALANNTTGLANLALGYNALLDNVTGSYNLAIGTFALENCTGSYNFGIGYQSLNTVTTGTRNTGFGFRTLRYTTGSDNLAIGYQAGAAITTGTHNIAIGTSALPNFTTGSKNVGIGYFSGGSYTTNENSVYIGYNSKGSADGNTNETVIGYSATGNGSNSITLGNVANVKTIIPAGDVGIGVTSPSEKLTVSDTSGTIAGFYATSASAAVRIEAAGSIGSASLELESASTSFDNYIRSDRSVWISNLSGLGTYFKFEITSGDLHADGDVIAYSTTTSDARLKDDVKPIENAIDKVKAINGVEYTWNAGGRKGQRDLGVIAQNVEEVIPEIVREKKMDLIDGEVYKTVDYDKLTALLIEAVKEQQKQIEELKAQIDGLSK